MKKVALIGLAAISAASIAYWQLVWNSSQNILLRACEDVLAHRLLSPLSYKRIEVSLYKEEPAVFEDYLGQLPRSRKEIAELKDRFDEMSKEMTTLSLWIKYESQNGFGGSIQNAAECSIVISADASLTSERAFGWNGVRVNGLNETEWINAAAREQIDMQN